MFKFLKEKLKGAISKISRKIGEEKLAEEPIKEKPIEPAIEQIKKEKTVETEEKTKPIIKEKPIETEKIIQKETQKTKEIKEKTEPIKEKISEEKAAEEEHAEDNILEEELRELEYVKKVAIEEQAPQAGIKEEIKEQALEKKKGFFSRITEKITTTKISREKFESLFSELELILMENNVAMEVIDKIKNDLSKNLVEKPIKRTRVEEIIKESLRSSIEDLFNVDKINLIKSIKNKGEKPFVIAFFGINGSGKTTSIAKVANMLKQNKLSVVLAASDTFRAASIEQLQQHADKLGVKMIRHDYGSDPAAVAFDAIKHAKAKNADAVLIDTAGRLHSQQNLMEEMKKIMRVAKPDLKVFVGESITGNDCVEQAQSFNDAVGIDGLILAKADVDEKGGAAISVSYITKKPIMYLGVGQEYKDLKEFEPRIIVESLGL
ncbi:signal recognition particle-docking protein FtsY [Candidatus Woesearchaeota archaeon]|nr:signal recognition particle-docking protein FtsY [Candidatus Woesearchaeota archaeon]